MITPELKTQIRRLFYAEHWKIGTCSTTIIFDHRDYDSCPLKWVFV